MVLAVQWSTGRGWLQKCLILRKIEATLDTTTGIRVYTTVWGNKAFMKTSKEARPGG
jgi:hypothetical protein